MNDDMFSLRGATAVITGASGVLGGRIARTLGSLGAQVGLLGRRQDALLALAEELRAAGAQIEWATADVLDRESLVVARSRFENALGPTTVLVNAAGGNRADAVVAPDADLFALDDSAFRQVVDLNLRGALLPTLVFGEGMAVGGGSVINLSSMAADRPLTRVAGYSAGKAALDNLTRWLAVETARRFGGRIRVNAIAPGFFVTEQNRALLLDSNGEPTARGRAVLAHTPMARFGDPADLLGAVVWLASPASRFVTGIVIPIDGGFSAFSGV
jgi:NAD(P)-dependent dehydrogenase (short-subunit alcohol dehydrogenase family)